ncbi:ABC transporter permease [Pseudoxanthobacter sp. M-2]|uniref:ABC transporter permease n=1 Tax=Pseudoxanthobacter sp. M-2 TaxID=3078754 RepID=UPI0038FC8F6A
MARFLIRRAIGAIVTMFLVSIMVFIVMELPPGDYADRYAFRKLGGMTLTPADVEDIRHRFGLDRPAPARYFEWIGNIVTKGDFGPSFAFATSVNNVIGARLWLTLAILFATLILTYLLSIPVGIYAAVRRRSAADYSLTVFSYLGLALPNFLVALFMLYFSIRVFDTSIGGLFSEPYRDAPWSWGKVGNLLTHLFVPAVVLAWSATAFQLQTVRATMLDELGKLSVTAARARGIPEFKLILKYPARLAINPVVSTMGFDGNRIFSELPIVALVLALPELGELLLKSFLDLDMYVAGAILLMMTVFIVVMNFISDVMLTLLDPRIRLQSL